MKTVSQVLKSGRLKNELSLNQVSKDTKIPLTDLTKIEEAGLADFPDYTYLQGMVLKYARYLHLNIIEVQALLKRETREQNIHFIREKKIQKNRSLWYSGSAAFLLVISLLIFFGLQFLAAWQKPLLTLTPIPQKISHEQPLVVKGKVDLGVLLYLNDQRIYQDDNGNFSEELYLKTGEKTIHLKAIGTNGKVEEKTFSVKVQ